MIKEHDVVVLKKPIADHHLEAGDVGAVVHVFPNGRKVEVEFTTLSGATHCIATVDVRSLRPVANDDLMHARPAQAG